MSSQSNGLISTLSMPEQVDLVRKNFVMVMDDMNSSQARRLYKLDTMTSATKRYDETDKTTYAGNKAEGANSKKGSAGVGYNKTIAAKTVAIEVEITLEMRQDARETEVLDQFRLLTDTLPNRMDLDLSHQFTFGTATSYVDQDGDTVDISVGNGLALFSASQTLAFSSETFTNIVPNNPRFGAGSLRTARKLFVNNIFDNFGVKKLMTPDTIISTDNPDTIDEVDIVLKSTGNPDGVHEGIYNPQKGRFAHIVLPRLATDINGNYDDDAEHYWGLASLNGMDRWQGYLAIRKEPTLVPPSIGNGMDVHNYNWTYSAYTRYAHGALNGKGIVFSFAT